MACHALPFSFPELANHAMTIYRENAAAPVHENAVAVSGRWGMVVATPKT